MSNPGNAGRFSDWIIRIASEGVLEEAFIRAVADGLKTELVRRGLLHRPPRYLGFDDYESWAEPRAFESLAVDAIQEALLSRRTSLVAKAQQFGNIDGLVRRNLGYFVTERQRAADPIGYNVFKNVQDVEWDTMLFFFGVIMCVGSLQELMYLTQASEYLYDANGPVGPGEQRDDGCRGP